MNMKNAGIDTPKFRNCGKRSNTNVVHDEANGLVSGANCSAPMRDISVNNVFVNMITLV